jgi:hypothetical protein
VGLSDDPKEPVAGVPKPYEAANLIKSEVEKKVTPPLEVEIDVQLTQRKKVIQITVAMGETPPYVIDEYKIYVRDETDTNLAVRDELVALVKRSLITQGELDSHPPHTSQTPANGKSDDGQVTSRRTLPEPKTGVEIVHSESRKGQNYYSLRDLRNGNIVHNVTRQSARKLWQYALTQHETNAVDESKVEWTGDIGLWKKHKRAGQTRYDLVQRDANRTLHVYYGVTENGIHGPWQKVCGLTEDAEDGV